MSNLLRTVVLGAKPEPKWRAEPKPVTRREVIRFFVLWPHRALCPNSLETCAETYLLLRNTKVVQSGSKPLGEVLAQSPFEQADASAADLCSLREVIRAWEDWQTMDKAHRGRVSRTDFYTLMQSRD